MSKMTEVTEKQVINLRIEEKKPYFPSDNEDNEGDLRLVSDVFIWNSPENWYRRVINIEFMSYGSTWLREEFEDNKTEFRINIISLRNEDLKQLVNILTEKL